MNVILDATIYDRQPAGIGQYVRSLVDAYIAQFPDDHLVLLTRAGTSWPGATAVPAVGAEAGSLARLLAEQARTPRLLRRLRHDVVHFADYRCPLVAASRAVVTIHDLAMFRFPDTVTGSQRRLKQWFTRQSVRRAAHIIVPSRATKNDLVTLLGAPPDRITVVPHGVGAPSPSEGFLPRHPRPYFLFVGTLEPRKNVARMVEALGLLRDEMGSDTPDLVVAGKKGWLFTGIFEQVARLGLQDRVIFLGYVSRDELPAWYAGALGFCFPTLYEGFGMPILEAMASGCPVITSNRGAAAEVAEGAAALVDPEDVSAIADTLRLITENAAQRARLLAAGRARASAFTWERTARETRAVYERVVRGG